MELLGSHDRAYSVALQRSRRLVWTRLHWCVMASFQALWNVAGQVRLSLAGVWLGYRVGSL